MDSFHAERQAVVPTPKATKNNTVAEIAAIYNCAVVLMLIHSTLVLTELHRLESWPEILIVVIKSLVFLCGWYGFKHFCNQRSPWIWKDFISELNSFQAEMSTLCTSIPPPHKAQLVCHDGTLESDCCPHHHRKPNTPNDKKTFEIS